MFDRAELRTPECFLTAVQANQNESADERTASDNVEGTTGNVINMADKVAFRSDKSTKSKKNNTPDATTCEGGVCSLNWEPQARN